MTTPADKTKRIRKRYLAQQKITDSDVRWLIMRSERLVVADELLAGNGYEVGELHYQPPLENRDITE